VKSYLCTSTSTAYGLCIIAHRPPSSIPYDALAHTALRGCCYLLTTVYYVACVAVRSRQLATSTPLFAFMWCCGRAPTRAAVSQRQACRAVQAGD
jgi:hypothetical protein